MSFIKQSTLFTLFLINVSFVIRYYSVHNAGVDINLLSIALNVIITSIFGGIGFYFGQVNINMGLTVKQLVISAVIVFLMSHTLSASLDLYRISLLAYAGVLFAMSFLAAMRGPKLFNK